MRTNKGRVITAALAIAMAIVAPSAFAQSQNLRATIPFDFYVADQLLPAGTYMIARQGHSDAIRIYNNAGKSAFVMSNALSKNRAPDFSRLVFHRYGSTSFLTGIYWEGSAAGRALAPTKTERRLAQNAVPPTPVAILLK